VETTTNGLRYPDATDPATIWTYFANLAQDTDQYVQNQTSRFQQLPGGDDTHSQILGTSRTLTGSGRTTVLTSTFTLDQAQLVYIGAKLRIDNAGSAEGDVGITITVDGTIIDELQAGPVHVPKQNTGTADLSAERVLVSLPPIFVPLTAGSHTVNLEADRDTTGQLSAVNTGTINGRTYNPTTLTVIV
jgi:hypothetical protein